LTNAHVCGTRVHWWTWLLFYVFSIFGMTSSISLLT
jgi:hypothetical protein